ncbi:MULTISPECIES: amidohydrolase family protein [Aequorivita]|uniref:PD40 domain-containing protein n=1 Tax=Aequorivita iocasae TaxID=2803865 RepID=A0ABX7DQK4_9FLAO|nr:MULTISPECIES: amidohydrolase family protein [Aequorivita]QQX76415.1 PD40 domain-containing protein [Aequorivita iocasae]UCA55885.1 amidohydrolase family protein [Aequorivita sp. F7]
MKTFSLILSLAICTTFYAQKKDKKDKEKEEPKWEVANPGKDFNYKTHSFTTNEGTWMNLDISPDGKTIVFDMLGDIYTLPISGGTAKAIRTGIPFEIQPRFNPDGTKISFTSDAGGGDNIWVMNIDGSEAKQVTEEDFRLLNNAVWSADGNYLIARKHFTSERSLGAGEMWQYHKSGGTGLQITKRKNDQQDVNEPFVSPDGKYLYYSEDMYPGGYFQYNKDPNDQIYVIKRYDFETGKTETITGGPGGAARPTISRDGKKLAFVKRVRTKSVLFIQNLETGEEWPIYDKLNKDQQEAWAIFGVYPNFSWMPNNDEIVFWSGGKINKINVNSLEVTNIPFTVNVKIDLAETVHFNNKIETETFTPKMIRHAVTSPNGEIIVFSALGHLYKKILPNGEPTRLTNSTDFEFEPAFSPNGSEILYVTWNDLEKGAIYKISANGVTPVKLTSKKGIYRTPSYSPNGTQITFRKENGNTDQGFTFTKNDGIYVMNADGSNEKFVIDKGEYPLFSKDGKRIFLQTGGTYFGDIEKKLISVNLEGNDEKTHVTSKYANRLIPSPDNDWIAFTNLHKLYVAPLVLNGHAIDLDDKTKALPVSQLAKDASINIHWSPNSQKVMWTLGDEYFSNELKNRFTFLKGSPEEVTELTSTGTKIGLQAPVDKPSGKIAFTNARIITMENDEVIENGTIVINENKIEAIGAADKVSVPTGAKVYSAEGKTIMPGMVDAHAHVGAFRYGLPSQQYWPFMANLAFGVTTSHDPSANTETVFTLSELQKSGQLVGPRLFSTGFILYGADGDFKAVINSLEDARSSIRRTKAFGAKSVKSYNQPRRDQRQQVLQAAREMGINVVPEGGSTFYHNITQIIDGHTGIEHNIPVAPVYKDILEVWGKSGTGYTPTLIVNYGGMNGEYYYYERDNIWENEKLLTFTPRSIVDSRSRHRIKSPQDEYDNGHILVSETVKSLSDAGVKVNMGAHGQLQGLGAHWETWMLQQGGMSNLEALKAATINAAEYIGAGEDIGSLKIGKLADLIVMDKNPLENIENTESIKMVMVNGRLYDTDTMNEIGNNPQERLPFFWEMDKYNQAFPWHQETHGFMDGGCSCH